jgi:hypothetical protein
MLDFLEKDKKHRNYSKVKNFDKNAPITSEVILITKAYKECDIDAWVEHYLNWCGFNHIIIIDNGTTCCNIQEKFNGNDKVSVIKMPSKFYNMQQYFYNRFANNNIKYTYQFFCDDDEYLWFDKTKYSNINVYLKHLNDNDVYQFGVPRVNISYESSCAPETRQGPMINECKYVSEDYYKEVLVSIKPFIHTAIKTQISNISFSYPHFINNYNIILPNNSEFNPRVDGTKVKYKVSDSDIKLFHYYHRSLEEWNEKMNRTRIDCLPTMKYKDYPTGKSTEYPKKEYTKLLNPFNR